MKFPSWDSFVSAFITLKSFEDTFRLQTKNDHHNDQVDAVIRQLLTILPRPFDFVAIKVYETSEGVHAERLLKVLDYLGQLKIQGQEHYDIIAHQLEAVTITILDIESMREDERASLIQEIRQIMISVGDNLTKRISKLQSNISNKTYTPVRPATNSSDTVSNNKEYHSIYNVYDEFAKPQSISNVRVDYIQTTKNMIQTGINSALDAERENLRIYNNIMIQTGINSALDAERENLRIYNRTVDTSTYSVATSTHMIDDMNLGRIEATGIFGQTAQYNASMPQTGAPVVSSRMIMGDVSNISNAKSEAVSAHGSSTHTNAEQVYSPRRVSDASLDVDNSVETTSVKAGDIIDKTTTTTATITQRHGYATFPKEIPIGESALLRVVVKGKSPGKIDQPEISQGSGVISVTTDGKQEFEDILVGIDPQSVAGKFEVKGRGHRVIHVPLTSDEDSKPIYFELVAKGIGHCNIVLEFIQKSEFIGNVELITEVIHSTHYTADNKPEQEQQQTIAVSGEWNLAVGDQNSFPYDDEFLGLIIRQSSSKYTYDVLLQRGPYIEELDPDNPTLITLQNDPSAIFSKYFDVIEDNNTIPAIHDDKLRSIGKGLYGEIFPKILKDFIWEHRDEIKRIHVLSKEPWIPWEIMVPFKGSEEDEFLCQRYIFSRSLLKRLLSTMYIKKARLIGVPNSSALKHELDWLTNTFSQANQFDKRPASTHFEVIEGVLKKGGYDLLHFSSHGQHDRTAPMLSTISLENNQKLYPNDLLGKNSKFGEDHPLVILNSCQSASQSYSITGIQSWVTNFINAGAAAVIGTAWSVDEESAVEFSKALYANLSEGNMTVAEAVHKARLDCKKTGNATWLAYVYYGSPALRIKFGM